MATVSGQTRVVSFLARSRLLSKEPGDGNHEDIELKAISVRYRRPFSSTKSPSVWEGLSGGWEEHLT